MKITVYTVSYCPFSKQEKEYLKARGLAFEEKNLEENPQYLDEMLKVSNNFAGTPVTVIQKDDGSTVVLKGFTKEEFEKVLGPSQTQDQAPSSANPQAVAQTAQPKTQTPQPSQPVQSQPEEKQTQMQPPSPPTIQQPMQTQQPQVQPEEETQTTQPTSTPKPSETAKEEEVKGKIEALLKQTAEIDSVQKDTEETSQQKPSVPTQQPPTENNQTPTQTAQPNEPKIAAASENQQEVDQLLEQLQEKAVEAKSPEKEPQTTNQQPTPNLPNFSDKQD